MEQINAIIETIKFIFKSFANSFDKISNVIKTYSFENLIEALPEELEFLAKILLIIEKITK